MNAKRACHVMPDADEAMFSASARDRMELTDAAFEEVKDDDFAWGIPPSKIFRNLGCVPFSCVTVHEDDLQRIWDFLHQRYSANMTLSKAADHSFICILCSTWLFCTKHDDNKIYAGAAEGVRAFISAEKKSNGGRLSEREG